MIQRPRGGIFNEKHADRMATVFFVLSFSAVAVLFGSIIAMVLWLIMRTLRILRRLLFKRARGTDVKMRVPELHTKSAEAKSVQAMSVAAKSSRREAA
jgi:hypothetical protein